MSERLEKTSSFPPIPTASQYCFLVLAVRGIDWKGKGNRYRQAPIFSYSFSKGACRRFLSFFSFFPSRAQEKERKENAGFSISFRKPPIDQLILFPF